jgi:hypothetical protein
MYQIITNGKIVGLVDSLRYIKVNPTSGAFVQADGPEDAQGIAVNGTPYNLLGHNEISGAPECIAVEKDGFSILFQKGVELDQVKDDSLLISDALFELDESTNEKIVELQDAVMELASSLEE